jgi:hypothetical protein
MLKQQSYPAAVAQFINGARPIHVIEDADATRSAAISHGLADISIHGSSARAATFVDI